MQPEFSQPHDEIQLAPLPESSSAVPTVEWDMGLINTFVSFFTINIIQLGSVGYIKNIF